MTDTVTLTTAQAWALVNAVAVLDSAVATVRTADDPRLTEFELAEVSITLDASAAAADYLHELLVQSDA